jgi:L-lactate dehydrogenase complex protein LldF
MAITAATFTKPRRLAAAQTISGALLGHTKRLRLPGPGWIRGWFHTRDLTPPARQSFRAWWRREHR